MNDSWYTSSRAWRGGLRCATVLGAGMVLSCGSGAEGEHRDLAGVRAAETSVASSQPDRASKPAAVIGTSEVGWEELRSRMAEAAGGMVLEEIALDRMLREQIRDRGIELSEEEIAAERVRLVETLQRSAAADQEQSTRLILGLQRSRGYGPTRFAALLERNAMLRRLVQGEVSVDADAVAREMQVRFGPKKLCRLIMVATENEASRLRARLASPVDGERLEDRFAAEARTLSLDPSGKDGGLLPAISGADVSYAAAVRRAVEVLGVGELSPVIVLERGYAVLYGSGEVPATEAPPGAREEIERELRTRYERVAMDRLAQRLLNSANVTVFDPALNWSWEGRASSK